jgi:lysyl-tRNA synthetase class I
MLLQIPGVDVVERVTAEKGSALTERERAMLDERIAAATGWWESYAPDRALLSVRRDGLPTEADALEPDQRGYLAALAEAVASNPPTSGDDWQTAIFTVAAGSELAPGQAFAALYLAFLGRANGPRAGWLLASLPADFVIERLRAAAP